MFDPVDVDRKKPWFYDQILDFQPLSDGSNAEAIQASETESYNDEH